MSINTAMTAIADKIRGLLGLSGAMGLDAMASNLAVEQTNIADAYAAVSSKGGTMPESQVSGNLAAAIGTISTGGLDTSDATATSEDIADGKTAYVNGQKVTGTVREYSSQGGWSNRVPSFYDSDGIIKLSVSTTTPYLFRKGFYLSSPAENFGDATASDVAAGKTFTSTAGLKVTGTHECTGGIDTSDATATASDILSGKTAYVNGKKVTGSIASRSAQTITPGTSDQTIASGQYLSGKQTIKGDANLLPGNIKSGVSVFGVDGAYVGTVDIDTSDATATADDMAKGKTAYVNGQKITGTLYEFTENTTEILGHQNTEVSQKTIDGVQYLLVRGQTTGKGVTRIGSWVKARTPLSTLGDASASDVAAGKTFTSSAGLKVTGTHECSGGIDTSDATATANDIEKGKTAYVNGEKITGSLTLLSGLSSEVEPGFIDSTDKIKLTYTNVQKRLIDVNGKISLTSNASNFGDAEASDVAKGKTFTSAVGLKVIGTHECTGGIDTSDATATANDMAKGVTAYAKGKKITGSLPIYTSNSFDSQYDPLVTSLINDRPTSIGIECKITERSLIEKDGRIIVSTPASKFGDATAEDVASGKTFTSAAGVKVTGTHKCAAGLDTSDATATASDILSGKTAYVNGQKITGSIASQSAQTITPGTTDKTISSGKYLSGTQTIKGDSNLLASNIKSGVSIFGVAGTYEGSGDASGGIQTQHITSTNDTITISGTGTVKVWGYGYKSAQYAGTTYAFVGDGYYSGSYYGQPSKTSATFSISDGKLSGLPSGLTALDLLVTIGI